MAESRNRMRTKTIFNAVTVAANDSEESVAIDLNADRPNGSFSIQVNITGDGTCKFEYLSSNDGVTYRKPSGADDIASSLTKTSGELSDGNDFFPFTPDFSEYIKIRCTETGTSDSVTITVILAYQ